MTTTDGGDRAGSADHDGSKQLEELLAPGTTVMFATAAPHGLVSARPLTVARVDGDTIRMLIDSRTGWASALSNGDPVHVGLSDTRDNTWMSLSGTATISTDDALIDELWSPPAAAYFDDGRDTPGIAALSVQGTEGEYWSSASGRLGSIVSMVRAAVGDADDAGSHGSVEV